VNVATPGDLCPAAVKAAQRLQALADRRVYTIVLVKAGGEWFLSLDDRGQKIETVR